MRALIALGANLGDRRETLTRAVGLLQAHPKITAVRASRWHETAPVGGPTGQGAFLNGAAVLETSLSSDQLLAALHETERALGRVRGERWEARTLDMDLLLFGDEVRVDGEVAVPHPRMAFRRFVLAPAAEVAADMLHPLVGWTVGQLLAHLDAAPPYVALAGLPGAGKSELARSLSQALAASHEPVKLVSDRAANGGASQLAESQVTGSQAKAAELAAAGRSTSPALERQLEFLERRSEILDRKHWPAGTLAISDFWFDAGLAHAETELNAAEIVAFVTYWQAVRQQVVLPRLVVMLDTPLARAARWVLARRAGANQSPPGDSLANNLLAQTVSGTAGPVLYLDPDAKHRQLAEILAAIAAMR